MKTKIAFLFLVAYSFVCAPEATACYTYYPNNEITQHSGTISRNGIDAASNTTTVWFIYIDKQERVKLDYYFNLPVRAGNRLRIYQATPEMSCYQALNYGTPIFDTDTNGGGFHMGSIMTDYPLGSFAVRYDVAFVSHDFNTYFSLNFSGGETVNSNLHEIGRAHV